MPTLSFGRTGVATAASVPLAALVCLAASAGPPATSTAEAAPTRAAPADATTTRSAGSSSLARYAGIRHRQVRRYAAAYRIEQGLAELVYETALGEGVDPHLAFRLVRVESGFHRWAVGPAGSVGLAQVRPRTARWLDPDVTREELFEPGTNLRIGFRYLRLLLRRYGGNVRLALLAYNRGPATVSAVLALGEDPGNGYARRVLGGMSDAHGTGPPEARDHRAAPDTGASPGAAGVAAATRGERP